MVTTSQPVTDLDPSYSDDDASPTEWSTALDVLESAEVFWVSTVRPDGRPHVTSLIAVWVDNALVFCTGLEERKAKNLVSHPHCVLTTGTNTLNAEGLDVMVEGEAVRITDDAALHRVAEAYVAKYGEFWRFQVRNGAFHHDEKLRQDTDPGAVWVFRVAPTTAFGFAKGETFSQTRWRFER